MYTYSKQFFHSRTKQCIKAINVELLLSQTDSIYSIIVASSAQIWKPYQYIDSIHSIIVFIFCRWGRSFVSFIKIFHPVTKKVSKYHIVCLTVMFFKLQYFCVFYYVITSMFHVTWFVVGKSYNIMITCFYVFYSVSSQYTHDVFSTFQLVHYLTHMFL